MRFKQHCHHRLPYRLWHLSVHRGYHCFDTNIVVKINRIILVQHKFPPPALSPQQFSTSLPPSPLYLPLPPATTTAALHCLPITSNTLSPPASGHHHRRHPTPYPSSNGFLLILCANCISFGMMVTLFAWIAHKLESSSRRTINASAISCAAKDAAACIL
jgi:hypothetical protein